MSNFDLNNEADFLRATGNPAATALLTLAGLDPSLWDIEESYFQSKESGSLPAKFHIFKSKADYNGALSQIVDKGGNRKIKYTYPYLDGQTTDDIGKKAQTFELDVMLFGSGYKEALKHLVEEISKPSPGELLHPVRGIMDVVLEEYEITHTYESRNAARIRLIFTEHNFSVGSVASSNLSGFKDALKNIKKAINSCLAAFAAVDAAIATVQAAVGLSQQLKNLFTADNTGNDAANSSSLNDYKKRYGQVLSKINKSFNTTGSEDIPAVVPVNEGGARNTDGTLARNTSTPFLSPNDPLVAAAGVISTATVAAIESKQAVDEVNSLNAQAQRIITALENTMEGQGAVDFADTVLQIKKTAILIQTALKAGIQSSNARVIKYTVPRLMSLREVAFLNGLSVDSYEQIDILNPSILSVNYIPQGTVLRVPVS